MTGWRDAVGWRFTPGRTCRLEGAGIDPTRSVTDEACHAPGVRGADPSGRSVRSGVRRFRDLWAREGVQRSGLGGRRARGRQRPEQLPGAPRHDLAAGPPRRRGRAAKRLSRYCVAVASSPSTRATASSTADGQSPGWRDPLPHFTLLLDLRPVNRFQWRQDAHDDPGISETMHRHIKCVNYPGTDAGQWRGLG